MGYARRMFVAWAALAAKNKAEAVRRGAEEASAATVAAAKLRREAADAAAAAAAAAVLKEGVAAEMRKQALSIGSPSFPRLSSSPRSLRSPPSHAQVQKPPLKPDPPELSLHPGGASSTDASANAEVRQQIQQDGDQVHRVGQSDAEALSAAGAALMAALEHAASARHHFSLEETSVEVGQGHGLSTDAGQDDEHSVVKREEAPGAGMRSGREASPSTPPRRRPQEAPTFSVPLRVEQGVPLRMPQRTQRAQRDLPQAPTGGQHPLPPALADLLKSPAVNALRSVGSKQLLQVGFAGWAWGNEIIMGIIP